MTDVSDKPVAWAIRGPCGLQYFDSEAVARTALESNQRLRRRDWPPTGKVIPLYTRPADEARECRWTYSDDDTCAWETECGEAFCFTEGDPAENKQRFCGYCGGKLIAMQKEPGRE